MTTRRSFAARLTRLVVATALPALTGLGSLAWAQAPAPATAALPPVTLLNVSYDPTRELYVEYGSCQAICRQKRSAQSGFLGIGAGSGVSGLR